MKTRYAAVSAVLFLAGALGSGTVEAHPRYGAGSPPCQQGGGRVVNNGTLVLSNCTVSGVSSGGPGGGISNEGTLTLTNVIISNNTTTEGDGGGLYNNGTLTATNVRFIDNSAGGDGGGLYNVGTATLSGVTFSGNSTATGDGGAMYNESGTVTLQRLPMHAGVSLLSNNRTPGGDGGAIYNSGGTIEIVDTIIRGNRAVDGGAAYDERGTTEVQDADIINNMATQDGGGIYEDGGSFCCGTLDGNNPYAANFTLAGNVAGGSGGGIYSSSGALQIMGATIADNKSKAGGGIAAAGEGSSTQLKAVLLARNTPVNCQLTGKLISDGYNLDTGASCGFKTGKSGMDLVNVGSAKVGLGKLRQLGTFLLGEALQPESPGD